MRWSEIIKLIAVTNSVNALGDTIEAETEREVFANKKSIRQNEFYQAMTNGLKAELMFEIRSIEYADEKTVEYNSKRYNVIRVYDKNGETMELICNSLVNRS